MPLPIDQNHGFQQRLTDFAPELSSFLVRVWNARATIDVRNYDIGSDQIYGMYSGSAPQMSYSVTKLMMFVDQLKRVAGTYNIKCQGLDRTLGDLSNAEVFIYGRALWNDFFHVFSTSRASVRSRVYVHAVNWPAGIEIMRVIVGQYTAIRGLTEAKVCGPGSQRLDTMVAYLSDDASHDTLIKVLMKTAKANPALFTDSLPLLIKREAVGIGSSDEPPQIEIKTGHLGHSFGSFFSALIWVGLKNTPRIATHNADGRHLLDNVLYSLRLLRVDPRNPTRFPEAGLLEQWSEAMMLGF